LSQTEVFNSGIGLVFKKIAMIAIRLWGRLGNQLFQYSFGRALSERTGEDLYFYVLEKNIRNESVSLSNFNVKIKFLKPAEIKNLYHFYGSDLLVRIERKLTSILPFIHRRIYIEKRTGYTEIAPLSAGCYDGYWQSYRYFSGIADQLRQELKLKDSVVLPEGLEREISGSTSVAIHIRRGDYLSRSGSSIYAYCGPDYYRRAIGHISGKVPDASFFVFSDDIEWVSKNFTFLPEGTKYVEHTADPSDCIEISLMRNCSHNIIANSTFSWWGAFLGDQKDKIVIAPESWYINMPGFIISDLIPSEWILM
jgi:hypothetical protein